MEGENRFIVVTLVLDAATKIIRQFLGNNQAKPDMTLTFCCPAGLEKMRSNAFRDAGAIIGHGNNEFTFPAV